jgi:hypothetical protein
VILLSVAASSPQVLMRESRGTMCVMKFLRIPIVFSKARLISQLRRGQQEIGTFVQAPRERIQRVRSGGSAVPVSKGAGFVGPVYPRPAQRAPVGLIRVDQAESAFGEDFLRIRSDRGRDTSTGGMR